jgi:nifR3 family TIM-barrel protein
MELNKLNNQIKEAIMKEFSQALQQKINQATSKAKKIELGRISFDNSYILAPMASICNAPFRLLMQDLGCGGSVSELISCHGINYGNQRTLDMLRIDPREKNIGIQLFGEDAQAMRQACDVAMNYGPKFLDINMGCPVRKVVTKGGGSALMRDLKALAPFLATVRKELPIPLSIKIRLGWDADQLNADEIIHIAYNEGIEWVAIHGRTRAQQYTGFANWNYIENVSHNSPLPIIGNGDLHTASAARERMSQTHCQALMIARGALRNPFIFLEAMDESAHFTAKDYWEVIERLYEYIQESFDDKRVQLVQLRKLIVWFAAGFANVAKFRGLVFSEQDLKSMLNISQEYFLGLDQAIKYINHEEVFMTSGHG